MSEKRLLIAALMSLVVITVWQMLFPVAAPVREGGERLVEPSAVSSEAGPQAAESSSPPTEAMEAMEAGESPLAEEPVELKARPVIEAEREEAVVVTGEGWVAEFTNRGAQLVGFRLPGHKGSQGGELDLVHPRTQGVFPFGLVDETLEPLPENEQLFVVSREERDGRQVVQFELSDGELGVSKEFAFLPDGRFEVEIERTGSSDWGLVLGPGLRNPADSELDGRYQVRSAVYRVSGELEKIPTRKGKEPREIPALGVEWFGLQDTFFLTVLIPEQGLSSVVVAPIRFEEGGEWRLETASDEEPDQRELVVVARVARDRFRAEAVFGSKVYEELAALEMDLEQTVDFGVFRFLSRPLLWGLNTLHQRWIPNYGVAIILMTFFLKLGLFPLTHKSHVSMQRMQKLNPQVQAIRRKYKSKLRDKQGRFNLEAQRKMQEEMQALYKAENVNPMGGCLPMLVQLPIFFAFFRLLPAAVELRGESFLWLPDLTLPDPIFVLPLAMGASQLFQQRLTPMTAMEPMQRRIMQMMPIMFTVFAFSFPSGLVLYWMTSNLLGIVQIAGYNWYRSRQVEA